LVEFGSAVFAELTLCV